MAGRPRQFDIDSATDIALGLFIQKGYEGATFGDLTQAMGISPPSFYAAFGSKEALFRRALDRYAGAAALMLAKAVGKPSAREVAEHLLNGLTESATCNPEAKGCLLVQGVLVCGDGSIDLRRQLQFEREKITAVLTERFRMAEKAGDRTLSGTPEAMARFVAMVLSGIAVQAASGVSKELIDEAVSSYIALLRS